MTLPLFTDGRWKDTSTDCWTCSRVRSSLGTVHGMTEVKPPLSVREKNRGVDEVVLPERTLLLSIKKERGCAPLQWPRVQPAIFASLLSLWPWPSLPSS